MKSYDEIFERANRQQACKRKHWCERRQHVMDEWFNQNNDAPPSEQEAPPCLVCDAYEERKAKLEKGVLSPFLIVCYGMRRYCYSSAEGGCWADWLSIAEVRKVWDLQGALKATRELKEKFPQPRYDRFSCANGGEEDFFIQTCYSPEDPMFPKETTQPETYE